MARKATGKVESLVGKDGQTYRSLRFTAYGKRRFVSLGVVSEDEANRKLARILDEVAEGTWRPLEAVEPPADVEPAPTLHVIAEEWWTLNEGQWSHKTRSDYRWRLECHLLPYFGEMPVDQISASTVKRYIAFKIAEGDEIREAAKRGEPVMREYTDKRGRKVKAPVKPLAIRSINMTLTTLGAIQEHLLDDDAPRIERNTARGRKLKERKPARSYLDTALQIRALLDAAAEMDAQATKERKHIERFAMIAVLIFAGLRINELLALCWRDVDLAAGWLHVGSKTDAGYRKIKIRGALRDALLSLRSRHRDVEQSAFVFPTSTGAELSPDNFRGRVLGRAAQIEDGEVVKAGKGAVGVANARLEAEGLPPLPAKLTPHSLRRTFCSVLYALGVDPGVVMDEMGHTDPALALRVYRQSMRRDEGETRLLRELVEGSESAVIGSRADFAAEAAPLRRAA